MSTALTPPRPQPNPEAAPEPTFSRARGQLKGALKLITALLVLMALIAASLLVGSNPIPVGEVVQLLQHPDESFNSVVVHEQRVPRTILLILVGAALGVAGSLIQSLTRNPLADPGILGINAGASLAVVLAVAVFGLSSVWFYLWFAFGGAAIAAVGVYVLGGTGRAAASPERLALAGVAISMAMGALVQTVILSNQDAFNEFRFWAAGSAEARGYDIITAVAPFIVAGLALAVLVTPALNAMALGLDTARSLGVRVNLTRAVVVVAVTLLAGAATAGIGPVMFIGLAVPYLARAICGPDQRLALPWCIMAAPAVMLLADVLARVVLAPSEVAVGIMSAILGGPFFIVIVRRRRLEAL
ncbi:Ferric enterobactin transport system permease protein FepD [Corynebacterium occultum]|uniref:Ferric enterobactin transport system permease protein FepD n=1 Tax=Corynebacterium occultum TaxID=2675219 RepID=A0A6B8W431_9CORY|nr:iron ABC transporter permease [Corynebacterium occultum]QGU08304.1 Ferric enterobactin transport system permease protein FepD [Corynebacterium occultum]